MNKYKTAEHRHRDYKIKEDEPEQRLILPLEPLEPVEAACCHFGMTEPWTLSDVFWTIAFTMVCILSHQNDGTSM